jgi:hypothetical protein
MIRTKFTIDEHAGKTGLSAQFCENSREICVFLMPRRGIRTAKVALSPMKQAILPTSAKVV